MAMNDVTSLFSCVPVNAAIEVAKQRLLKDDKRNERTTLNIDQILGLLSFCLSTTYLMYRREFYQQTQGTAMESPVSPIVVNLYMKYFEELALKEHYTHQIHG